MAQEIKKLIPPHNWNNQSIVQLIQRSIHGFPRSGKLVEACMPPLSFILGLIHLRNHGGNKHQRVRSIVQYHGFDLGTTFAVAHLSNSVDTRLVFNSLCTLHIRNAKKAALSKHGMDLGNVNNSYPMTPPKVQEEVEGEEEDHGQDSALRGPPMKFYCSHRENSRGLIVGQNGRLFSESDGNFLENCPISVRIWIKGEFWIPGGSTLLNAGKFVDISTKKKLDFDQQEASPILGVGMNFTNFVGCGLYQNQGNFRLVWGIPPRHEDPDVLYFFFA